MCHGPSAGNDLPLCQNLLEPAESSEKKLPSSTGLSAQGEEAGLLLGAGSCSVCMLLDSSAPDELSSPVPGSSSGDAGNTLCRQVTALLLLTQPTVN